MFLCPQQMLRAGKKANICIRDNVASFAKALSPAEALNFYWSLQINQIQ